MSDKVVKVIAEALRWSNGQDGLEDWSVEATDILAALKAAGITVSDRRLIQCPARRDSYCDHQMKFGHVCKLEVTHYTRHECVCGTSWTSE